MLFHVNPDMHATTWLDYFLPAAAILAVVASYLLSRRDVPSLAGMVMGVLFGLAALAVFNYADLGKPRAGHYINDYDVFHYYTGAKYAREVRYLDLYHAAAVADAEGLHLYSRKQIGDLRTGYTKALAPVLAVGTRFKGHFTDTRWAEFCRDARHFSMAMGSGRWGQALCDQGYNGSPVWSMAAGAICNRIDSTDKREMLLLALIDPLLLFIGACVVAWAYGTRAAMLAIVLFGSHFAMSFGYMKGGFLRMDWLVCLVGAVCCARKGRYTVAGALLAVATLVRVFPAIFLLGPGVLFMRSLWEFWRGTGERKALAREAGLDQTRFFAAFAITAVVLAALSYASLGQEVWSEYLRKIRLHNNVISHFRVGFKYLFLDPASAPDVGSLPFKLRMRDAFAAHQSLWWSIQAGVLAVSSAAVYRLREDEALAFGFVPFYFLVAPTFYYYVILLVPFLFFCARNDLLTRAAGSIYLFATSIAGFALYGHYGLSIRTFHVMTLMFLVLACYMIVLGLSERSDAVAIRQDREATPAGPRRAAPLGAGNS